ncbi:MAG: flippase-like domain-containing protein [Candidatus Coatesbacteria bacterium]|nr:MAG: flippase-like domain-containing protein [Candidatus Coatesbacteria bacterium]
MAKFSRKARILVGLAVSLVSAVVLAFIIDWREFAASLARVNYVYLIPATACILGSYYCRALQWRYVLGNVRRLPSYPLFRITMIGFFANAILPARLGEVVRAYILARKNHLSKGTAFGSVIVTRLLDGAILFLILGGLAILIPAKIAGVKAGGTTGFLIYFALVSFFVLFYFNREAATSILKFLFARFSKRLTVKIVRSLDKFIRGFSCFRSPADLGKAFLYSGAIWLLVALSYYFVNLGFKFTAALPLYAPLMLVAIVSLAISIPSSPGFIGTMELGIIAALHLIEPDLTRNEALSYAIVVHVVQVLPAIIIGLFYSWTEHLTIADFTKAEEIKT